MTDARDTAGNDLRQSSDSNPGALTDQQLVETLEHGAVTQPLIDEYYRRCIPVYLDILGIHWHTGFYHDDGAEVCPADQERMVRCIADSIGVSTGDRVLDVGCGVGGTACILARDYGSTVRGLTPVPEQRNHGLDFLRRFRVDDRAGIDLGHAAALPYPPESFDAVVFFESPCHFPDRRAFFEEVFRVLKPGGRIAGEDWLACRPPAESGTGASLETLCQSWFIPALGSGEEYLELMRGAGMVECSFTDMRTEMALDKGFAVTGQQRGILTDEIRQCANPLVRLILKGLLQLGEALDAGSFTVGRFSGRKPARES